ncbi:AAA family ATPase [Microcoleus sp. S28C3]|uniref:AAA family ATPase n=1 Tax=Microcoleus sp. S28C3 TaxID=3055414 RepID=UPI002FD43A3F
MLESFQIHNFRLFQHLEVRKLNRVNLIVGKNNAGKSTFLEAVELYASNASPTVLLDLVESRQETWFSEAQPHSQNFISNSVRHLFCGHKLPIIGEKGISLGEVASNTKLHISAAAYQNKNDDEGTLRKIRISEVQLDENLSNVEIFLIAEEGERTRRLFSLDLDNKDLREIRRRNRMISGSERKESELKYTWQIVSTENMPNRKLAALWDLTSLTDLESEVISALGLINDRVTGVAFVENNASDFRTRENDQRIALVKIKGIDEPLPLKSMGDGMTRLFHIIVALVNARNGLLLIDEFENGLHWSVQPKVWDIVFQLSDKLNVQVFATTHSRDCIKGFDQAWNNYPTLGAFFRLDEKNGLIKATEYTSETLNDSMDMDVEVR